MGHSNRYKLKREKHWRQDPHCRRCGVVTYLPQDLYEDPAHMKRIKIPGVHREQLATIGHRYSRLDPRRKQGGKYVLICHKCNQKENMEDCERFAEEFKRRSDAGQRLKAYIRRPKRDERPWEEFEYYKVAE
jgi:hypothetical protein